MSRRAISAFRRINGAMDGFFNNVSRCCADQIEIARHLADAKRKNRIAVGSGIHRPHRTHEAVRCERSDLCQLCLVKFPGS